MTKREIAMQNFRSGYNCAQAVAVAFADEMGIDTDTAAKLASSFGGGMGRLREVCGTVTGMFLVVGMIKGYCDPKAVQDKKDHYALVQDIAAKFREKNGSIICRELLGGTPSTNPVPEARTAEYYKKRPCVELVGDAAEMLEELLAQ